MCDRINLPKTITDRANTYVPLIFVGVLGELKPPQSLASMKTLVLHKVKLNCGFLKLSALDKVCLLVLCSFVVDKYVPHKGVSDQLLIFSQLILKKISLQIVQDGPRRSQFEGPRQRSHRFSLSLHRLQTGQTNLLRTNVTF